LGPDAPVGDASRAAMDLMGKERADVVGARLGELIAPDNPDDLTRAAKECGAGGRASFAASFQHPRRGRVALGVTAEPLNVAGQNLIVLQLADSHLERRATREAEAFAMLAHQLSAVSTPQEAAMAILRTADALFGWDAAHLNLYPETKDRTYSVVSIDTVDGVKKNFPPAPLMTQLSPMSLRVMEEGAILLDRGEGILTDTPLISFGTTSRESAALMFVPIRKGTHNFGVLSIQSYTPGVYSREDLQVLQVLADHCSGALDRTLGEAKLRQQVFLTRKLSVLGKRLSAARTPNETARVILETADELFGWDAGFVNAYDEETDRMECIAALDTLNGQRVVLDVSHFKTVPSTMGRKTLLEGGQIINAVQDERGKQRIVDGDDAENLTPFGNEDRPSASLLFVPIRIGSTNVGLLSIQSYSQRFYSREELDGLQVLADHCGGALRRTFVESRLRASEEHLRLATSQVPAVLWSLDRDGRFTLALGERLRALGRVPSDLVGNSLAEFARGATGEASVTEAHEAALQGGSGAFEMELNGVLLQGHVQPLRDDQGEVVGALTVALDVSARHRAEERLRKFRKAIEQTANSVLIAAKDFTIEYVNPAFERLTGWSSLELVGRSLRDLRSGEYPPEFYEELDRRIVSGRGFSGVIVNRRRNGEFYYEEKTITPLRDEQGEITHFVDTGRDITEKRQAEVALREAHDELERRVGERTEELSQANKLLKRQVSQRRKAEKKLERSLSLLRATLEATTDGIVVVNLRGIPVNYNQKVLSMWNVPPDVAANLDNSSMLELVRSLVREQSPFQARLARPASDPADAEPEILELRDGRIYECWSCPQLVSGRSVGRVWSFRDVTQRRRSEEALARSEAIYRGAIENAQGVPYRMRYSSDGYDFMGDGIEQLLGIPPRQMAKSRLEQMVQHIDILDPDAPADIWEYWRAVWRGEVDQYRVDLRLKTPDGQEKWVNDCSVPIRDEKTGEVIGALGILQDVTRRKQVEEQNRIQQERLVKSEKLVALGTLVSGVAHEINNPNNFIMLNAPMLLEVWRDARAVLDEYREAGGDFLMGGLGYDEMREQVPELIQGILEGAKRIRNIVQELRDFARPHPDAMREPVDVNGAVRASLVLMHSVIERSTSNFTVSYGEGIPHVMGNFQRIEQVLINLVQNACQSLERKSRSVWVATHYDQETDRVLIRVGDEGRGISADLLTRITDPFFTTKRDTGGIGLGLSISSNIVHEHGGTLEFSSEAGRGTVATIALPARRSRAATDPPPELSNLLLPSGPGPSPYTS